MTEYKLYLGLNDRDGAPVSRPDVNECVNEWVKNLGLEGFTLLEASGYWQGSSEPSLVLIVLSPTNVRDKMEALAILYGYRFNQQAVMLTQNETAVSFIEPKELVPRKGLEPTTQPSYEVLNQPNATYWDP